MILVSLLAAIAAVRLRGLLAERRPGSTATLVAGAGYLVVVVIAGLRAAVGARGAEDLPGRDAVPLPRGLDRHAGGALDDDRARLRRRPRSAS